MPPLRTADTARRTMVAVTLALAVASVAYRLLVLTHLEHTSLVFIGIPTVIALALLRVKPDTAAGSIHKTIALGLCLSGVVFGEAFICILMAAPLFFCVGAIVARVGRPSAPLGPDGLPVDENTGARRLALLLLLPMSLEGVAPRFELPRAEEVVVTRLVPASPEQVRAALASPMRFEKGLPLFFRLGYPVPGAVAGHGLTLGDRRMIEFLHGGHHPGTLVLEVTHSDEARVLFTAVSDDSYITHWLSWREAEVNLRRVGRDSTEVSWALRYSRRLDPAWYFKPLERYGVSLAAEYLIETLATPRERTR